ncbi:uncharacterized protein TRAVEDRAFT_52801 [Trametes versicolor FP-101664 SS1]|uniref:uncharacterized protein n=1 Tax=Trametes versicolor (strain FP-101664) TaxID=717944 RepID=UPI000462475C|nr:uncharacterized protein TRAVEDRAFT_52801 [Trametes versicolor FP-101664 SS1]EIW53684.1 hypothetical protein TRAVEDRAFT_52801 [Trametes versicolor FP-101664 SS1]
MQALANYCPFTDPASGDVIICTSDQVKFCVHRVIIANASPVFADMFSFPQPTSDGEKPVVDVTESDNVWRLLLDFCYLRTDEPSLPLHDILGLLEAARKYRMAAITTWMRRTLSRPENAELQALRTYAIACAYDLPDVARLAARGYLSVNLRLPSPVGHKKATELDFISATQYARLLDYHKQCSDAAVAALTLTFEHESLPSLVLMHQAVVGGCRRCRSKVVKTVLVPDPTGGEARVAIRPAWTKYIERLKETMKTRPVPAQALSSSFLDPAIRQIAQCKSCCENIHGKTKAVAGWVQAILEAAISDVQLEVS